METLKYLDICNINGELLVTLLVRVRDEKAQPQVSPEKPSDVQRGGNGLDKMTEAQQRKLFRMLAEKGIHGDKAHEELKRRLQVNDLGDVSKQEASRMIEKLIAETKGGR
ncbi:MAG: hypothetical protein ABSC53_04970 [Bacteroidota bacterium]|jgi:hypothetical protein